MSRRKEIALRQLRNARYMGRHLQIILVLFTVFYIVCPSVHISSKASTQGNYSLHFDFRNANFSSSQAEANIIVNADFPSGSRGMWILLPFSIKKPKKFVRGVPSKIFLKRADHERKKIRYNRAFYYG